MGLSLLDKQGNRKYLNADERALFLAYAQKAEREIRTLCGCFHRTGCRVTEAVELTANRVDLSEGRIVIRSLKKRSKEPIYRAIPVPPDFLDELELVHNIRRAQSRKDGGAGVTRWKWKQTRTWQLVKAVMEDAGINPGPHRTPKGLRQGFGIAAIVNHVPLNMLCKWMGHADIKQLQFMLTL